MVGFKGKWQETMVFTTKITGFPGPGFPSADGKLAARKPTDPTNLYPANLAKTQA